MRNTGFFYVADLQIFGHVAGGEVLEGEGAVWFLRVALPPQER
jgi:hypothetical protein